MKTNAKKTVKKVVKVSLRERSNNVTYKLIGFTIKRLDDLKEIAIGAYEGTGRAIEDYQANDKDL